MIWMNIKFGVGLIVGSLSSLRQLFEIRSIMSQKYSYGSRNPGTEDRYELNSKGSGGARGILKTDEVITVTNQRNESQERFVFPSTRR
jgi:hypothetical protein